MTSPRSTLLPLAALLLAALPATAANPPATPSFGESVEVHVVNVDVYVTDRDGHRVTGLRKDDFTVTEDGKTVGVTNFEELSRRSTPAAVRPAPAAPPTAGDTPATAAPPKPIDPERQPALAVFVDNLHIQ